MHRLAVLLGGFIAGLSAQTLERTLYFSSAAPEQEMQEVATIVRSIVEIRELAVEVPQRILTFSTDPEKAAAAEWLFDELLKRKTERRKYRVSRGSDDFAWVLQLPEQLTPRELQEVATVVRSVGSIQRVFIFNRPRLLVIRGTEEEIASGEWVAARLTAPTTSREQDYALASHPGERLRVIFLKRDTPKQDLFELALTIRALGDVVALFTCDAAKAVVMRVTGHQAALASWLTTHLTEQRTTDSFVYGEDAVRVFYLPEPDSPVAIQETAKQIRSAIGIKRLSVYNAGRAMALRAAPTQISQVEQLLKERYP